VVESGFTIAETAALLAWRPARVYDWAQRQKLRAGKDEAGSWVIDPDAVETLLVELERGA
jgi:dihydroorotase-like cyclic amidohydrolase